MASEVLKMHYVWPGLVEKISEFPPGFARIERPHKRPRTNDRVPALEGLGEIHMIHKELILPRIYILPVFHCEMDHFVAFGCEKVGQIEGVRTVTASTVVKGVHQADPQAVNPP
jgi:hypothetical protein